MRARKSWASCHPLLAQAILLSAIGVLCVILYRPICQHNAIGFDFRDYYISAAEARQGHDSYSLTGAIGLSERLYGLSPARAASDFAGRPNMAGPFTTVLMSAVAWLPPSLAYLAWLALLLAALVASLWGVARLWPLRSWTLARLCAFGASPMVFWSLYLGQTTVLVLASWVATLGLLRRRNPFLAGLVLAGGLALKPQLLAGPAVLLAVVLWSWRARWRHLVLGCSCGLAAAIACVAVFAEPGAIGHWLALIGQAGAHMAVFDDVSSLSTFYVLHWPRALVALNAATIAAWALLCLGLWLRQGRRDPQAWLVQGSVLWLLATPYVHSHDSLVLLPALWLFWRGMRSHPHPTDRMLDLVVLTVWWIAPYATMTNATRLIPGIQGLGILVPVTLAVAAFVVGSRDDPATHRPHDRYRPASQRTVPAVDPKTA